MKYFTNNSTTFVNFFTIHVSYITSKQYDLCEIFHNLEAVIVKKFTNNSTDIVKKFTIDVSYITMIVKYLSDLVKKLT